MIQNKYIVDVKGDKDSGVVITKKSNYASKLYTMIDDGIMKGTYVKTTDNMLKDFRTFYIKTFISMSAIKICNLIEINQHVFIEQLKPTNFVTLEEITVVNFEF